MSVSRSVAQVLADHVALDVEGIDRMYLNVYVPGLQREQGVATFLRFHRGHPFASSALMDPISKAFVAALGGVCAAREDSGDSVPQRSAQGRHRSRTAEEIQKERGSSFYRQSPGENAGISHRASPE